MPELHFNKTLSSLASEIAPELCGFFRNETVRLASLTRVYYSNSLVGVTLLVSHKLCGARLHFQILNANLLRFEILHTDRRPLANLIMRFSLGYHSFLKAKLKLLKYFEISTAIHMLKGSAKRTPFKRCLASAFVRARFQKASSKTGKRWLFVLSP